MLTNYKGYKDVETTLRQVDQADWTTLYCINDDCAEVEGWDDCDECGGLNAACEFCLGTGRIPTGIIRCEWNGRYLNATRIDPGEDRVPDCPECDGESAGL